jgi:AraC-like DNA-binding protein
MNVCSVCFQEEMPITKTGSGHLLPECIQRFLFIETNSEEQYLLLPDGHYTMVLFLGSSKESYEINQKVRIGESVLIGQMTKAWRLTLNPGNKFIVVRLNPYSFYYLTGLMSSHFTDQVVNLDIIFKHQFHSLISYLKEDISFDRAVKIIEKNILEISGNHEVNSLVINAVNKILFLKGNLLINEICEELKVSKTTLEKYFIKFVGISPKMFSKFCRLKHCVTQKSDNPHLSLTNIAYESSYYDQSHFIKEFKAVTGMTPQKYFKSSYIKYLFLNCNQQSERKTIFDLANFSPVLSNEKFAVGF